MTQLDSVLLRRKRRPKPRGTEPKIRVVDLFAGAGGLSVGLFEAAFEAGIGFEVGLAVDTDSAALDTYKANFPDAATSGSDVRELFDGELGSPMTAAERETRADIGRTPTYLLGGPPCQGHSDLNNRTRRSDPKNQLYLRMARAAEVLGPMVIVVENVPTVLRDRTDVVGKTRSALHNAGYSLDDRVVDLHAIGVPQRRRRHLLIAARDSVIDPERVLALLESRSTRGRTVRWAIGDLEDLSPNGSGVLDRATSTTEVNRKRIDHLFDEGLFDLPNPERPRCHQNDDHSYKSMYGRLRWDEPAQTVTTGFGSMGQGRYVHPSRRRTITPHEAARLQAFPDWFDWTPCAGRTALARLIGNAVPPLLTRQIGRLTLPAILTHLSASDDE